MNIFEKIKEKIIMKLNYSSGYPNCSEYDYAYECAMSDARKQVIEIVEQVEKQCNNCWIPCSERLPEEGGHYLVTYHEWSNGDYLPKFNDIHVRRMHYQASDHFTGWNYPKYVDENAEKDTSKEVIAWQPLPEPYKESENE